MSNEILIEGSEEFKIKTNVALALLKKDDPVNFRRVNKYIDKIVESPKGGFMDGKNRTFYESLNNLDGNAMYAACMVHEAAHLILSERFGLDWYDNEKIPINWIKHEKFAYGAELRCLKRIDPENSRIEKLTSMLENPTAIPNQILQDLEGTLKANPNCPPETRTEILEGIQRKMAQYLFSKYGPGVFERSK